MSLSLVSPQPAALRAKLFALGYVQSPQLNPILTLVSGGALTDQGTAFVRITGVQSGKETFAGPEVSLAVTDSHELRVASPAAGLGFDHYNVYEGATSGSGTLQNTSPIAIGTAWTEPSSGFTTSGATVPTLSGFYKGITVQGNSQLSAANTKFLINTGNIANDIALARFACRRSELGNGSGGFGAGLAFDRTVDQAVSDYINNLNLL